MKTIFIQYHSGLRQVITDTADNLLELVMAEIDHIEAAHTIEHIDNSKRTNNNNK
jgi:hypothetical protein